MRIAFVGKGGSGKSTVSWLFTKYAASNGMQVLAIDADYNMDLAHNLGWTEQEWPFISSAEKDFYKYLNLSDSDKYVDLPLRNNLPKFNLNPFDSFTAKYALPLNKHDNIKLIIAGHPNEETTYGSRCSHAYYAPLKYYLGLVEKSEDNLIVLDSVAGSDMINYGLYLGVDAIISVVEPTENSINVFNQIKTIANKLSIPVYAIFNKYRENEYTKDFFNKNNDIILGKIPIDTMLMEYSFDPFSIPIKESLDEIWFNIKKIKELSPNERWERFTKWRSNYDIQNNTIKGVNE